MGIVRAIRLNQSPRILAKVIRRLLQAQQFPEQISQHQGEDGDGHLLDHVAEAAANAEPGEPQSEEQGGCPQQQFEKVLGLRRQRRPPGQADDPADDDARCVQNCSCHGQD